jgi:hypothetical protein
MSAPSVLRHLYDVTLARQRLGKHCPKAVVRRRFTKQHKRYSSNVGGISMATTFESTFTANTGSETFQGTVN